MLNPRNNINILYNREDQHQSCRILFYSKETKKEKYVRGTSWGMRQEL